MNTIQEKNASITSLNTAYIYAEPVFSSGVASYDASAIMAQNGWTTLTFCMAQFAMSASAFNSVIRSTNIVGSTIGIYDAGTGTSGARGVYLLIRGQ